MSDRFTPPPARDLPPASRETIRAAVLRSAQPPKHRRPRCGLAALAVGFAAAVALLIGISMPRVSTAPLVAAPTVLPTSTTSDPKTPDPTATNTSPTAPPPAARRTEEEALPSAAARTTTDQCLRSLRRDAAVETVHFARRTSVAGDVVLFTDTEAQSYLCSEGRATLYDGSDSKTLPLKPPTAKRPVVQITGPIIEAKQSADGDTRISTGTAYLVDPRVVSLQMRITNGDHAGPWFEASIADGYAYAGATLTFTDTKAKTSRTKVEERAHNQVGDRLAVDHTAR